MRMNTGRNYNIDVLRAILALLVVYIHFPVPSLDVWISPISRLAVPTFYLISGYYLPWSIGKITKIMRSILKLTLIWAFIFLLYSNCFIDRLSDFIIYSPRELVELLLFNRFAHGFHLWYLSAYLYALLFVCLVLRFHIQRWRYVIISMLLLTNLILGDYSKHIWGQALPFFYTRNGLLLAFPLLLIGRCVRADASMKILYKYRFCCILLVVSIYVGCIIEKIVCGDDYSVVNGILFIVVASSALLVFTLTLGQGKETIFSVIGRRYSLYIYLVHPFLIPFVPLIYQELPMLKTVLPLLVFMLSAIVAVLIVSLKNQYEKITC